MRGVFAFLASLLFIGTGELARASAAGATYSLGWTRLPGAESCVAGPALARAVEARVGHSVWAPASAADVVIEGHVEKRSTTPGWRVHVVLSDAKGSTLGERDLATDDVACQEIEPSLILMLALIIDPRLLLSREQADAPSLSSPQAMVRAAEPALESRSPEVSPSSGGSELGRAEAGYALAVGLLPGLAGGIVVDVSRSSAGWSAVVGGALFSQREVNATTGDRRATFSIVELSARGCRELWGITSALLIACAGPEAGVLVAQGFGFSQSSSAQRPVVFLSASSQGSFRIAGPVWAGLRLGGGVPLLREEFRYLAQDGRAVPIFRISPVVGAAEFTLGLHY